MSKSVIIAYFSGVLTAMVMIAFAVTVQDFLYMEGDHSEYDSQYEQEVKACESLSVKYGDAMRIKSGFYEGAMMIAVEKHADSIGLVNPTDPSLSVKYIQCSLVEKNTL